MNLMKTLLIPTALLSVAIVACNPPEEPAASGAETEKQNTPVLETMVTHVDAAAATMLLAGGENPTVLDVRTPEEFAEGHIEGAVNVDFKAEDFAGQAAKLDKSKPYLVHCRSGKRSTASLEVFKELGFSQIYHLDGGYLAWEEHAKNPQR